MKNNMAPDINLIWCSIDIKQSISVSYGTFNEYLHDSDIQAGADECRVLDTAPLVEKGNNGDFTYKCHEIRESISPVIY